MTKPRWKGLVAKNGGQFDKTCHAAAPTTVPGSGSSENPKKNTIAQKEARNNNKERVMNSRDNLSESPHARCRSVARHLSAK